jgi:glycosyltransferase involved in cell wall biosynthesis
VADYLRQCDPAIELIVVHNEPQPRLVQYMNACDALLFTSFQEGSPNIVKQALACNLPLVSTDVGDVREMLGDATQSYLCAPDVAQFAAKVSEILLSRARSNGREKVLHLSRPLVAQRLIAVYQEVLRRPAARSSN